MATHTAAAGTRHRHWQLPLFLLGLTAFCLAVVFMVPPPDAATRLERRLAALAEALQRMPPDQAELDALIAELSAAPSSGRLHFLLGSAYVSKALVRPTDSPEAWALALEHFQAVPPGVLAAADAERADYRRALATASLGRGDPATLILTLMNPPPGEDRGECPRLIAECALRLPQPDLARARKELTMYLGGPHRASAAAADKAKLKLAEIHLALDDPERAARWLRDISSAAPAEVQATGRQMLARLAAGRQQWSEAADVLEAALSLPNLPPDVQQQLRLELGVARERLNQPEAAAAVLEQAAAGTGPNAAQAALRLAELLSHDGTRRAKAADWLERAFVLLPAEGAAAADQALAERVVRTCLRAGDFATAFRAATMLERRYGVEAALALRAEVQQGWAEWLRQRGDAAAGPRAVAAAADYTTLANRAATPQEAARCHLQAARLLQSVGERTAALAAVDRSLALQPDDAEPNLLRAELLPPEDYEAIRAALERAANAASSRQLEARTRLGLLLVDRGQELLVAAPGALQPDAVRREGEQTGALGRNLLRQVADTAVVPAPQAAVHEQALFEHGRLALRDLRFADAEAAFKKLLSLYPTGRYAGYGRLWLVCAMLQQARTQENRTQILEEALAHLKPLAESEDAYLRTYGEIWRVNTLLELGDALAAARLARELMAKYRGQPEELVAGKLRFFAVLKQPQPDYEEAARTLARMEDLFAALPAKAFPDDPEYSRAKWQAELPRLKNFLVQIQASGRNP